MREKPTNATIIHSVFLIMYGSSYMFRHYIAIFKERYLSTAPQLSISQKALGTLPEDGNVMPKHVKAL
jgi:hypothetical protein